MLLGKVFQIAKKDVVHRNVKILSQKHPELISLYARHMTKDQILHFIKTNKPSILEKLNISKYVNFYDTDNSILDDIDVQIALYPSIPNLVLKNLDKNNPKAILQLGKAINWDTKLYSIIPNIERESVREYIVNSSAFPKDFREKIQGKTENIDRIEQDSDDIDDSDELKVNIQQREKEYAYLFRKNIHKLALRLYNGKKKSVLDLFNLYSNIVDIRSNTFSSTLKQSFNTWKTILKEQSKYFTPDEKITTEIGLSLRTIENFLKTHKEIDLKDKTELYKTSRYKNLVDNFVSYMVSFFAHLEIKVKPLPIVSDISGIRIIVLTTDSKEDPIAQQLSLVNQMKNKLTEVFLSKLSLKPGEEIEKEYSGVPYYETSKGFVSLETIKTYSSLGELLEGVKKHKIIDKNYSNLVLNQGKIINPNNNKVIGNITYLDSNTLQQKIDEYQSKIDDYNSNLKSYETPLTNDPKTIQVGDHLFNVVKILDKNLSRLVVIEGEYAGHFVDELVSTTGEVIGSKTKASPYLTETAKGMKELSLHEDKISQVKPFETFKKLNGIKDSTPSVDFIKKIDRNYLNRVTRISANKNITSGDFHKLTGLNIVSNIPNTTGINTEINNFGNKVENTIKLNGIATIIRDVYFSGGSPDYIHNSYFITAKCLPDGLGSRVFAQQVKTASELGFKYIDTNAARGGEFIGYYVWPKLGYDASIPLYYIEGQLSPHKDKNNIKFEYLKKWLIKNNIDIHNKVPLSAIYACKAGDRFIGQELWKTYGDSTNMEFNLTPGSLSMRILESYINLKSEKDNIDPSEFLKLDYAKYKSIDLECFLQKGGDWETFTDAIEHSIKNYENGVLKKIYRNPATRQKFTNLLDTYDIDLQTKNRIQEILNLDNVKLASAEQQSEDPILKELDMEILNRIWSGISKKYIQ
jgi:predicted transcriptional regulator